MSSGVTTVHQRRGASLVVRSADVKVQMDNFADPFATVLRIKTPSDLGDLGEMTSSIKKLGLNVVKASVWTETQDYVFYITEREGSEKINKASRLEEIRAAVVRGILKEGSSFEEDFAPGSGPTPVPASSSQRQSISSPKTSVTITPHATGSRSVLRVRTADRAGVLTGIVGILKDLSVNVVAAEVDTIGDLVDDTFFVTYQGEALSDNMNVLIVNTLMYHLGRPDSVEDSY